MRWSRVGLDRLGAERLHSPAGLSAASNPTL